ncbi:MAG: hypothetical protein K0U98_08235 [Deltaproteobacteria bacterium]|nr:hypothetical protein [Deltaproteobacteria bacterium]
MLNKDQFNRIRKAWIIASFGFACLVAVVSMAVPNGGRWVESGHDDCPAGMVCADWEVSGSTWKGYCCIPSSEIGSPDINACHSSFRHFGGGP